MRSQILLLVLMLVSWSATAQSASANASAAPLPAVAATDSATAIHRLFAAKRKTRQYIVGGTAAAGIAGVVVALNQPAPPTSAGFGAGIDGRPIMATLIGVATGALMGIELLAPSVWSRKREERAMVELATHQLPRYIKRQLKPRYFEPNVAALALQ
jgi:hypothetical protein